MCCICKVAEYIPPFSKWKKTMLLMIDGKNEYSRTCEKARHRNKGICFSRTGHGQLLTINAQLDTSVLVLVLFLVISRHWRITPCQRSTAHDGEYTKLSEAPRKQTLYQLVPARKTGKLTTSLRSLINSLLFVNYLSH